MHEETQFWGEVRPVSVNKLNLYFGHCINKKQEAVLKVLYVQGERVVFSASFLEE